MLYSLSKTIVISQLAVILMIATVQQTVAHSWLECTDYSVGTAQCSGYQRGWSASHTDTDVTYRILDRKNVPVCFPGRQDSSNSYTPGFPMAQARPGQTLTFTYLENGHVTKDRLPDKPDPKTYTIHWSSAANEDTLKMRSDLSSSNQLGEAQPFDDGQCSEDGLQPGRVKRPCRGTFTIPNDATPGRHQFVWWWKFDKAAPEEYTACFDVMILGNGKPSSKPTPPKDGASKQVPQPQPNPPLSGNDKCAGQTYNKNKYVCDNNQLCEVGMKACDRACYSSKQYKCVDGKLQQH
ncbi:hypothetical protein BDF22DRAFT_685546 [Syncephalis plumigaleata]|nr:hypothetical protein BDF22DRAFT_685546 [Syncephalis plumigaleata]